MSRRTYAHGVRVVLPEDLWRAARFLQGPRWWEADSKWMLGVLASDLERVRLQLSRRKP